MSQEHGIVVEVRNNKISVQTDIPAECGSCSSRGGCASLMGKSRVVTMENTLNASVGDAVVFVIHERSVLFSSVVLYFIPVVLFIAGLATGGMIRIFPSLGRDIVMGITGLAGLLISLVIIRLVSVTGKGKKICTPALREIIRKSGEIT